MSILDEVPFDIPDSWEWCRLSNCTHHIGSKENQILSKEVKPEGRIPVVSQSQNLIDGYCNNDEKVINVLPLVMFGDHTRNVKYIDFPFVIGADGTKFHKVIGLNSKYIFYWMTYAAINLKNRGYARHYSLLATMCIPIPPLSEQERIVNKVEELIPLIDQYGEAEEERNSLDNSLSEHLKKSVLQLAVQGKLVPQDPNDEPASVLLERIRAEKERLIKEGKIKRDKNESVIFRRDNSHYEKLGKNKWCIDDVLPYELPKSWMWCRLGNIGDWGSGATPSRTHPEYYGGSIPWLKTGDLNDGIIYDVPERISEIALENTSVRLNPVGSVLIAMYGATIGKLGIAGIPMTTNQACCACLPLEGIYNRYLFYYLMAKKQDFIKQGEGGAQPNISKEKIISTLMPIPPLEEQYRIVAKIEELLPIIKTL